MVCSHVVINDLQRHCTLVLLSSAFLTLAFLIRTDDFIPALAAFLRQCINNV